MWESNPPRTLLTPHTGFEDQEAHQLPIYPHFSTFKLLQHIIIKNYKLTQDIDRIYNLCSTYDYYSNKIYQRQQSNI